MKTINQATSIQLLAKAKEISDNAYAPYSKFKVGAALITPEGMIFTGCNVENASYGLTLCAERSAMSSMVKHGYNEFEAIAIYAKATTDCYPCGACRQWLYEFGKEALVIVEDADHNPKLVSVSELLPHAFGPDDLV
ncbi:MAG: cytidine deaminase [Vampirovibrionia bacterium]